MVAWRPAGCWKCRAQGRHAGWHLLAVASCSRGAAAGLGTRGCSSLRRWRMAWGKLVALVLLDAALAQAGAPGAHGHAVVPHLHTPVDSEAGRPACPGTVSPALPCLSAPHYPWPARQAPMIAPLHMACRPSRHLPTGLPLSLAAVSADGAGAHCYPQAQAGAPALHMALGGLFRSLSGDTGKLLGPESGHRDQQLS